MAETPTGPVPPATTPARASGTHPATLSATERLLSALVEEPWGALHAVADLDRGVDRGRVASALLRSGVPVAVTARLCGVAPDDLGSLIATSLGVMPPDARATAPAPRPGADDDGARDDPATGSRTLSPPRG